MWPDLNDLRDNMKKLLALLACSIYISASMVDAVAIIVNNEPITLLDIVKTSKALGVDKQKATELLIERKLEEAEIKRLGIDVDEYDLNKEIENFAKSKGMSLEELKKAVESSGLTWQEYKDSFKKRVLKKRLYQQIAASKMQRPDEASIKEYYEKNLEAFSVPSEVEIIKYLSTNRKSLEELKKNPMAHLPDITSGEERVDLNAINPQLALLIQETKEGEFTPIIPMQKGFLLIFVKKKIGKKALPYEEIKNAVAAKMAEEQRKSIIKDYLAKLKVNAKIKVLRLP